MSTLETTLQALHKHLQECGEDSEFAPSLFDQHQVAWEELESRLGGPLPADIQKFYQRCDGFTDNSYTCFVSLEEFISELNHKLDTHHDGDFFVASVGDGSGMDDKWIVLLLGHNFRDNEPKFMFQSYPMDYDEKLNKSFRERVAEPSQTRFDEMFPLEQDELIWYGPATITELLVYILETAKQV